MCTESFALWLLVSWFIKTGLPSVHAFEKKNKNKESEDKNRCQVSSTEILLSRVFSFNSEEELGLVLKKKPTHVSAVTSFAHFRNWFLQRAYREGTREYVLLSSFFKIFYLIYISTTVSPPPSSHSLCPPPFYLLSLLLSLSPLTLMQKFNLQIHVSGTEWKLDPTLVFRVWP